MTTLTEDTLAHLGVLEDLTRKPRDLSELPPVKDAALQQVEADIERQLAELFRDEP